MGLRQAIAQRLPAKAQRSDSPPAISKPDPKYPRSLHNARRDHHRPRHRPSQPGRLVEIRRPERYGEWLKKPVHKNFLVNNAAVDCSCGTDEFRAASTVDDRD